MKNITIRVHHDSTDATVDVGVDSNPDRGVSYPLYTSLEEIVKDVIHDYVDANATVTIVINETGRK